MDSLGERARDRRALEETSEKVHARREVVDMIAVNSCTTFWDWFGLIFSLAFNIFYTAAVGNATSIERELPAFKLLLAWVVFFWLGTPRTLLLVLSKTYLLFTRGPV